MNLSITFRHMDPVDALKGYATEKVERLTKYFDAVVEAHVILGQEKLRHSADVTMQCDGIRINAKDESADFYSAIDGVVDKLERQLKRYKEKLKRHQPRSNRERRVLQETVYAHESFGEEGEAAPRIVHTEGYATHPMGVEEAVMALDLSGRQFMVFTDHDGKVKVVYPREDGDYGLIGPE